VEWIKERGGGAGDALAICDIQNQECGKLNLLKRIKTCFGPAGRKRDD